jgi:hypothetical protein
MHKFIEFNQKKGMLYTDIVNKILNANKNLSNTLLYI